MKEASIHIGTEKTGSTAIQHFLEINRSSLAKPDIHFPLIAGSANQFKLAAYCVEDSPDPEQKSLVSLVGIHNSKQRRAWRRALAELLQEELDALSPEASAIFSSEHLQSPVENRAEAERLQHARSTSNQTLATQWFERVHFSDDMSMCSEARGAVPDRSEVDRLLIRKIQAFCAQATKSRSKIDLDPADAHREAATLIERLDLELATGDMQATLSLRPERPYIQQKLKQYLKQSKTS